MALTPRGLIFGVDGGADLAAKAVVKSVRGTGWCLVRYTETTVELAAYGQVVGGPDAWLEAITGLATEHGEHDPAWSALREATGLVVENFVLLNARAKIDPLEIVGMMRMWGAVHRRPVAVRMPKQREAVSHDDLHRVGMWPGGAGHADTAQAIRHVLSWLMSQGHLPTIMLLAPPPVQ